MKGSPEERAALLAQYMIESGDTVRGAANKFCVSDTINIQRFLYLPYDVNRVLISPH